MSFNNYIFSVLSAKKSWFHCFIFGADNDTSAPSILFKLASPYLLHALAMAWEFTNTTLCFLPSILRTLSRMLKALILLYLQHFSQFNYTKIVQKILIWSLIKICLCSSCTINSKLFLCILKDLLISFLNFQHQYQVKAQPQLTY